MASEDGTCFSTTRRRSLAHEKEDYRDGGDRSSDESFGDGSEYAAFIKTQQIIYLKQIQEAAAIVNASSAPRKLRLRIKGRRHLIHCDLLRMIVWTTEALGHATARSCTTRNLHMIPTASY